MAWRCVECGRTPTHYLFPLLGCRLCPECEQHNPRFRLITELEVLQAHGLSAAQVGAALVRAAWQRASAGVGGVGSAGVGVTGRVAEGA